MNADILLTDHSHRDHETAGVPRGPFARIIAASVATGLVTALVLTMVVFPAATEATITGSMLVAFGLGWAMLGVLSSRFTNRPQRWSPSQLSRWASPASPWSSSHPRTLAHPSGVRLVAARRTAKNWER